jgi:dienelactone hydrolase
MKPFTFIALVLGLALATRAEIKTQTVEYKDGDATLKGFLAYDDAVEGKRPGIVVVPEWWGLVDYPKSRAEQLAKLGYVAFAADIYGEGYTTMDPKVAQQKAGEAKQADLLAKRGLLALEQLKKDPHVDPSKTAAIGYCFGGGTVLEMARRGGGDLLGVISFHGALDTQHPAQVGEVKAKILVCHGDADPFVPAEQLAKFEKEMKDAGADVKVIKYPDAKHAFTNPDVDKVGLEGAAYNKAADEKSWNDMQQFFKELFGTGPK